jgi:hypothetical protein
LLYLGQHANQLFNQADIKTRNSMLRFMAPANSSVYDKKLSLQLIYPYTAFIELNDKPNIDKDSKNWCSTSTWLRGLEKAAAQLEGDPLFNEVVEALQLRGDLLAV